MTQFKTEDSGKRVQWETGSQRDTNEGKERYDLVGRHGLKRLAQLMARGAEKYGERNWEKGQPVSRSYESAMRHLFQFMEDGSEDHLAAVAFNVFSIIHVEEEVKAGCLPSSLLDLSKYDTPRYTLEGLLSQMTERPDFEDEYTYGVGVTEPDYSVGVDLAEDSSQSFTIVIQQAGLDVDAIKAELSRRGFSLVSADTEAVKAAAEFERRNRLAMQDELGHWLECPSCGSNDIVSFRQGRACNCNNCYLEWQGQVSKDLEAPVKPIELDDIPF